jgi:hypothetical protein
MEEEEGLSVKCMVDEKIKKMFFYLFVIDKARLVLVILLEKPFLLCVRHFEIQVFKNVCELVLS